MQLWARTEGGRWCQKMLLLNHGCRHCFCATLLVSLLNRSRWPTERRRAWRALCLTKVFLDARSSGSVLSNWLSRLPVRALLENKLNEQKHLSPATRSRATVLVAVCESRTRLARYIVDQFPSLLLQQQVKHGSILLPRLRKPRLKKLCRLLEPGAVPLEIAIRHALPPPPSPRRP